MSGGGGGGFLMGGVHAVEGFGHMAQHFAHQSTHTFHVLQHALHEIGRHIVHDAKEMYGHYQGAHGPFNAWAPLAEATMADRVRKGFSLNDPLLRSGQMRDSVSYVVDGLDLVIGNSHEHAATQELGTRDGHIPPRPVLGPVVFLNRDLIQRYAGNAAVRAFVGGALVRGLGYDMRTTMPAVNTR